MNDKSSLENCISSESGGAVFVGSNSNMKANGASIKKCQAQYGGAIYTAASSKLTMTGGSITGCSASEEGGAIYTADNQYSDPLNVTKAYRNLNIYNTIFNSNSSSKSSSIPSNYQDIKNFDGKLLNNDDINYVVEKIIFIAYEDGKQEPVYSGDNLDFAVSYISQKGKIYLNQDFTISDYIYIYNQDITLSSTGSGIHSLSISEPDTDHFRLYKNTTLTMQNIIIDGNDTGGGVNVSNSKLVLNESSKIKNCFSSDNGAGVYLNASGKLIMNPGSTIMECKTDGNGGGIYTEDYDYSSTPSKYTNITISDGAVLTSNKSRVTCDPPSLTSETFNFDINLLDNNNINYRPNTSTYYVFYNANNDDSLVKTYSTTSTAITGKAITFNETGFSKKIGYTFSHWQDQHGGQYEEGDIYEDSNDIFFHAKYTPIKYPVTFDSNNGIVETNYKTVIYDNSYGTLPIPTRAGYTFDGWFTQALDGVKITSDSIVKITSPQTLYAQWTKDVAKPEFTKYTVNLNVNGGKTLTKSKLTVTNGKKYGTLPTPKKTGYKFKGWYTAKYNGKRITSQSTVKLTANQTLYAQWTANKYKITFIGNKGKIKKSKKYKSKKITVTKTYGKKYSTLPKAKRTGYKFKGWYTKKKGGKKVTKKTIMKATKNIKLYARWTRKK